MIGVLRLLRRGRAVLSLFGWCCGAFARDQCGRECDTYDDKACTFCMVGALYRAAGEDFVSQDQGKQVLERARELLWLLVPAHDEACIEDFNDNSDLAGVKALYDRAIRFAIEAYGPGSV